MSARTSTCWPSWTGSPSSFATAASWWHRSTPSSRTTRASTSSSWISCERSSACLGPLTRRWAPGRRADSMTIRLAAWKVASGVRSAEPGWARWEPTDQEVEMSGHSKWSSIKHKKGAADARRGKLFSKLSRALIVAAREGGPDPGANLALQNAIEKARSYSMPKDNIERAIARGSGADTDAQAFETVIYEGYGPGGVAVLVEALTDNRNRTAAEVRHIFARS